MSHKMKRSHYADMFGPTAGDKVSGAAKMAAMRQVKAKEFAGTQPHGQVKGT